MLENSIYHARKILKSKILKKKNYSTLLNDQELYEKFVKEISKIRPKEFNSSEMDVKYLIIDKNE